MKILYGVQGTGNGHIARARVMAKAFAKRADVEVDFVFSGRPPEKYFDMQVFGQYRTFEGLTFITENGQVNRWKTIQQAKLKRFIGDVKALNLHKYDVLLNDFEPITAWAAKCKQLDSISVSHQAAFRYSVPKKGESLADRLLMRLFAPTAIQLGVHWYHFDAPIMPPFIEETLQQVSHGEHVLVYLPFEHLSAITQLLEAFPATQFRCYHPEIQTARSDRNLQWQPLSKSGFQQSLLACAGVIANGGFELASECLQLGKKILVKPLKNQYEQSSNCITLERMNRCQSMHELSCTAVQQWLALPSPEPIHYPNNPDLFIDWLLEENWHDTSSLCRNLWQHTHFPKSVERSLAAFTT